MTGPICLTPLLTSWLIPWLAPCLTPLLTKIVMSGQFRNFAMFSMRFRIICFWIYLFTTVCFRIAGEMLTAHLTHFFKPNWQKKKIGFGISFFFDTLLQPRKKNMLLSNLNIFASTRNWILESFKDLAWSCDANMVGGSRRCNQTNATY